MPYADVCTGFLTFARTGAYFTGFTVVAGTITHVFPHTAFVPLRADFENCDAGNPRRSMIKGLGEACS